jgi:hypothetical protein
MTRCTFSAVVVTALLILQQSFAAPAPDAVGLRIRFGMKDKVGTAWNGKLTLSEGKVTEMHGWRFQPGDSAEDGEWTISTRRLPAQGSGDKARLAAGGKMPMGDNGFTAVMTGVKPDTSITFDTQPGKYEFKLSDVPYGKTLSALDGNLQIERVPAAHELATTTDDEDYPAIATAKDGTTYVAYVSFKHGKDFQGVRERPATPESGPNAGPNMTGRIVHLEKPEDFDYLGQPTGGEQLFLRVGKKDGTWSEPIAVTDRKQEVYRPAVAVDGKGRVWVIYSEHRDPDKNLDHGNWELMARSYDADGKNASEPIDISNEKGPDFTPVATIDSSGNVWIAWVGGRETSYNIFTSHQDGEKFTKAARVTTEQGNEWEPAIAANSDGEITIAWDTYGKGDYDVYLSRRGSSGDFEKPQAVAASLLFEVRPSIAYDKSGKLWIAWEVSGDEWGKDFGGLKKRGIPVYMAGRWLAMRVRDEKGGWMTPPDIMLAMPSRAKRPKAEVRNSEQKPSGFEGSIAPCYPKLATDPNGDVWLAFRGKHEGNWRVGVGSVWFDYVTHLYGDHWTEAVWLPRSNGTLDSRAAVVARDGGFDVFYCGDGRAEANPVKGADGQAEEEGPNNAVLPGMADDEVIPAAAQAPASQPAGDLLQNDRPRKRKGKRGGGGGQTTDSDLYTARVEAAGYGDAKAPEPALATTQPATIAQPTPYTDSERAMVKTMRDFRVNLNGENLRIWRGEFHRHTEYSPDGGNDGGLLDLWRYAIDAANLDWIGDGDHDYGVGREYSWWTTQKAVTLFTLDNHFTPVYSYERSVTYPEGHRNCMFAERGIRSLPRLPISSPDKFAPAPDTNMLYMYLKRFHGICAPHTSATDMGTDWRNHDPEVEPLVEIFQGDRNSYERPDSPRSAVTEAKLKQSTPEKESMGGWRPKGFVNLALLKGYRFAFESSSDHISTHLSYTNVYVTDTTREGILDAIRKKRVYGATDNIVADVRCKVDGKDKFMGEEFAMDEAPTLNIHMIGPQKFTKITIIKDDEVVHVVEPDKEDVSLNWTDPNPTAGKTSYYYVRGEQEPDMKGISSGELVWSSPMWIDYKPKQQAAAK